MAPNENGKENSTTNVDRVAMKVPPFWSEDPAIWFIQLEGQFAINNITSDSTRYYYVISNLSSQQISEVRDIITAPPDNGKYEKLKSELIRRLSESQENKTRRLLEHEELGDRTPSQFLRRLRSLAGTNVHDSLLRTIWTSRLPTEMQAIMATQDKNALDEVAILADKIQETTMRPRIAAVATNIDGDAIASLTKKIEQLTAQVAALQRPSTSTFNGNGPRQHYRSRSRSKSTPKNGNVCWFHQQFQEKARKCTPPCEFKKNGN